jgi:cytoskeletal protein CcmA (bactofilin family)
MRQEERRVAAWIGASVVIQGDLTSSENSTIAGRVQGDVRVPEHELVVERGAQIRGNITARAVVVHGEVRGMITASAHVEIAETGSVGGDVVAPRMVVHEGAVLDGVLSIDVPRRAVK